jgi:hypothetical protein
VLTVDNSKLMGFDDGQDVNSSLINRRHCYLALGPWNSARSACTAPLQSGDDGRSNMAISAGVSTSAPNVVLSYPFEIGI